MENSNQSRRRYWQGRVNNFKVSDGNKAAYCREQKINYHQFSYWYGRPGNNDNVVVPVTICDNSAAASGVIWLWSSGKLAHQVMPSRTGKDFLW